MGNSNSNNQETPTNNETNIESTGQEDMSYWQMAKQGYQELVNAIIRPPRCQYTLQHLGPTNFTFCRKKFQRRDFIIINSREMRIQCSMWEPIPSHRINPILPCVIYMHGNSSARIEVLPQLSLILSLGATVLAFDFSGSGMSDGEFVSLGYYEKDDLQCVVEHLRDTGTVSTIALWGRSMGAATALLHGERDPSIAGMVLDSSFASLLMLSEEMVEKGRQQGLVVPNFVTRIAIRWIRSSVQQRAAFDIHDLNPIEHADRCYIPALFVAGEHDDFIPPHHSKQIFEKYAGDKNIVIVRGDHNSMRPKFLFDSVGIFLTHTLQIPEHWCLERSRGGGIYPWTNTYGGEDSGDTYDDLSHNDLTIDEGNLDFSSIISTEEIGMTEERQAEIQNALYLMLGSARQQTRVDDETRNSTPAEIAETWSCVDCTLLNSFDTTCCLACGKPKS